MEAANEPLHYDSLNSIASKDTTSLSTVVWVLGNLFVHLFNNYEPNAMVCAGVVVPFSPVLDYNLDIVLLTFLFPLSRNVCELS